MKKTTLLSLMLFLSFIGQAQTVASESFDVALGWTSTTVTSDAGTTINAWARRTTGGAPNCATFSGAGMARFNSYNIPSGGSGRLTSPAITFPDGRYRVKLKMYRDSGYPTDADNIKVYYNTTGAAGGTILGTVNRSTQLAPIVAADGWYSYTFDIPGNISGTGYIVILGTSRYGNNIFIDQISVDLIQAVDAETTALNMNAIETIGNKTISGTIKNMGTTDINSFDVNWQIDNGAIYTQNVTGLTLAAGQTYNYSHPNTWDATPGLYSLKAWVSNVNGAGNDGDSANDSMTKQVSVASGSVARFPLYEKFSSATCAPCYSFNTTYFNPFMNTGTNSQDLALINYQVNWPGTGDPYYTAEIGARVQYYGINAAPTLLVDSKEGTNSNAALLQSALNAEKLKPAFFGLSATHQLDLEDLTVNINTMPYLTGNYKIHVAVVEKETTGNVATNGETSFHNVMMKMVPDPNGTAVDFTHDVATTHTLQGNLAGLNIEELNDLAVVVFIQDQATKAIMQAAYSTDLLANNTFNKSFARIWPNPSTGIINIKTENTVTLEITDITGKVVYPAAQVNAGDSVNLSFLQKGMYLAKMTDLNGNSQVQKIMLK
ncbi:T9SS type A sorting domain-containing protein [Flavobacterium sp. CYK-55]|uniref:T9SS-dependent choice-of-anchor J family protein n=1 Tax=Flavobacterium sp. CYK-55 TaxID=2835529 RepID=UPI001BCC3E69|nr:T9SS type A sorting domain-containing protein [Flavobacterium sp. CYK-55]MBS7785984.1 T9SS type A sorting domain-containing protein [Flavobacterium sp. CYK-55]